MASKDLDGDGIKRREVLEDMITCCICTEVYTDPKALPCIHTFCMKCIQETGNKFNKGPGDEMPCPLCRRLFKIPPEGFHALPKNFFIEKLLQVSSVINTDIKSQCDVCLQKGTGKETSCCVDCNKKLCKECCRQHSNFKLTKNHKLIPINENKDDQNVLTHTVASACEVHKQKVLDVYCDDCKRVVCANCFIEEHNGHKGSHVSKCVDEFRRQIEGNAEVLKKCRSHVDKKMVKLLKAKEDMQKMAVQLESDVAKRMDELKQLIDKNGSYLIQYICSTRERKLKEIQAESDDIDSYSMRLQTYNSFCQSVMAKGSANDLCRALSGLSVTVVELQKLGQATTEREIPFFDVCFRKSELEAFLEENCNNLIGEIEEIGKTEDRLAERIHLIRRSVCVETGDICLLSQVKPSVWKILSAVDVALLFADPLLPRSCLDFIIQWTKKLSSQIYRMKDYFSTDVYREAELLKHGAVIQERLDKCISLKIAIIKDYGNRKKMADTLSYSLLSSSLEAVVNELTSETSFLLEVYEKTNGHWCKIKAFIDQMLPLIVGGLIATAVHETCVKDIVKATANLQRYKDQMDTVEQKIQSIFDRCRSEMEQNMLSDLNEVLDRKLTNKDAVNQLSTLISEKYDWLVNYCIVCDESVNLDYCFVGSHVKSLDRNGKFGVIFYRDVLTDEYVELEESSDVASVLADLVRNAPIFANAEDSCKTIMNVYHSLGIEVKACAVLRPKLALMMIPYYGLIARIFFAKLMKTFQSKTSGRTAWENGKGYRFFSVVYK